MFLLPSCHETVASYILRSVIFCTEDLTCTLFLSFLRTVIDTLPIIDRVVRHVAITWTNVGGVLEVIVDGVLQSSTKNIASSDVISGSSTFIAGGNPKHMRNFEGYLFEMNMWDRVLPVDLLYLIARYKGNDRGNVVTWKGFEKSSDSPYFSKSSTNMVPQGKSNVIYARSSCTAIPE